MSAPQTHLSEQSFAARTGGLQRQLTRRQLSMIGLGGAIGTGLFLGSGIAISMAGPATILAYVVGSLVALVVAWALAEMVVVHPTAGAFGALAHSYIGRWAGFEVRWTYWTILCINIGGEVIAAGIYLKFWWPQIPLWLSTIVLGVALLAVNAAAVRLFGHVEYWFAMIKVSAIVVFILLGAILIFFGLPGRSATGMSNLTAEGGFLPNGTQGLFLAMVFVFFSFIGTEVVSVTAAESEDPVNDVRHATNWMIARLAIFYVLAIVVVLAVVPWTQTAQVGNDITASPFVLVFDAAGIPAAATLMNFVVLTAAISSANAQLYVSTRMLHSLAQHHYAPSWTGVLTTRGVPARALILSSFGLVIAALLTVFLPETAFVIVLGIAVFGAVVVWMFILVTHLRFRQLRTRHGLPASSSRLWGAPVTTVLALLFLVAVLIGTTQIGPMSYTWIAGVPFFVLLVIIFWIVDRARGGFGDPYDPLQDELTERAVAEPH